MRLLDMKQEEHELYKKDYGQYARILGFRKEASPLLHEIKNKLANKTTSKLEILNLVIMLKF